MAGTGPLLVRDDSWAPGLVGLVAGRLRRQPRPAGGRRDGGRRGSARLGARSSDFHVAAALEACAEFLTKRGGHAAAGGFSLLPESWAAFSAAFGALSRPFPLSAATEAERPGRLVVDLVLPARLLDWTLADQLASLAPYGPGHVEPVVAVTGMVLTEARRVGAAEQHVSLRMRRGLETFDAIAFGVEPARPLPEPGDALDLVGTLERDDFNGMPRLRLRVVDFAHTSSSPLLARRRPPVLARAG